MHGLRTAATIAALAVAVAAAVLAPAEQAPAPTPRSATTPPVLASADRAFIQTAAKGGVAEVALGELAGTHAKTDEVKKFGQRMVEDHGKANQVTRAPEAYRMFNDKVDDCTKVVLDLAA
jgi:predicted outer membrane protein